MEKEQRKSKCKKRIDFQKFIEPEGHLLASSPTSSTSTEPFVHSDNNKDEFRCDFCNLVMENAKLLEIHMTSCVFRNKSQIRKHPIPRSFRQSNCSIVKEGNQECDLRLKATMLSESFSSKSSRPCVVPESSIENPNFSTICTDASSSHISARRRIVPMPDSQKQRKVKLKIKVAKHQVKEKQTQITNPKIASTKEASDKLSKSFGKNAMLQRKYFKGTNSEVPSEKLEKNNSQKPNLKTSKQMDQKMRQTKKSDHLSCKSNAANKKVTVQLLLDTIPENDCGMLLQSSSTNKMEHYYKCCRCGKAFRSIKLGSIHYSNCKSNKLLSTEVSASDTKWVCTICHSSFLRNIDLNDHLKVCNIFTKNCEKTCEKCLFKCFSPIVFQKHDCANKFEYMKTCAVRLNVVKMTSTVGRVVMHECEFCCEIFDEKITDQHFQSHHPGKPSSGNFKQYFVNLDPETCTDTVVVKTEAVSPSHISNGSDNFQDPFRFPLVSNSPSYDSVPDNISMPPPPVNIPIVQSAVSLHTHQSPSTSFGGPSSSHSVSDGVRVINQRICRCANRSVENDTKPCLKCLSKLTAYNDRTKFAKKLKVVPFEVAQIKKEIDKDSKVSNSNTQGNGSTAVSSIQSGGDLTEVDMGDNLCNFQFLNNFRPAPSLTPPSSHDGISPPSTPLVQTGNGEPCSPYDVSVGSLNDISMVPIISELDEPRCPEELVHYINDDLSPGMALIQCDQELFTPVESCSITLLRDTNSFDTVDAWAMVPSECNETIEKYICSTCFSFICLDKDSIIKHLWQNHEKKTQFLAMYVTKSENESE